MNFRETSVTGQSWLRSNRAIIENTYNGQRGIMFDQETVINLDEGQQPIKIAEPSVFEILDNSNISESFDIVDPETGAVVGTSNYVNVYQILHSLYIHIASKSITK